MFAGNAGQLGEIRRFGRRCLDAGYGHSTAGQKERVEVGRGVQRHIARHRAGDHEGVRALARQEHGTAGTRRLKVAIQLDAELALVV